jgi:hypothetical protein
MSTELVKEKQPAAFVPSGHRDGKQSIQEQLTERREAVEAEREKKQQPRKEFLLTGKGKAGDHFEIVTNRETVERYANQDGAPQSTEDLSESAREKWLRTGELPPAKEAKKTEEAPGKKDGKEADAAASKEAEESKEGDEPKWTREDHEKRFATLQTKTIKELAAEKDVKTGKSVVDRIMLPHDLTPQLTHYFLRVVADTKSPEAVLRALADGSSGLDLSDRSYWGSERGIRELLSDLRDLDRKISRGVKKNGNANGAAAADKKDEKLTRAGKPPMEAGGGGSSPADDGSSDAAWRRKDLSPEARGELYRERKNKEEADARRRRRR